MAAAMEKIERNDDLLMAILLRLSPKPIFRFRSVSTTWNNIVTEPFFIQSYEARKRKEQFSSKSLEKTYAIIGTGPDNAMGFYPLINHDHDIDNNKYIMEGPNRFVDLNHSSNGLILCRQNSSNTYHILNPVTGTCVSLPPSPPPVLPEDGFKYQTHWMGWLIITRSDRALVPSYKVVQALRHTEEHNKLPIQTYSSKTGVWTDSTLLVSEDEKIGRLNLEDTTLVFDGIIHWFLQTNDSLVVYDSNKGRDNNHLQLINLPNYGREIRIDHFDSKRAVIRSFNDDGILWFAMEEKKNQLQFWMLPRGSGGRGNYKRSTTIPKTEWILMHTITYHSLCKNINMGFTNDFWVELLWLIPGNPLVAVLRLGGIRICLYNLETKSIVESSSLLHVNQAIAHLNFFYLYCVFYTEPLSLSSYALSPNTRY